MSEIFNNLVTRYKAANIKFGSLKPVTLAQWILESGRGTSDLAKDHLNFAGLKWRSEMVGFATPVEYEAHDGLDFYCKFANLDAFIVGYWKFLSRSPYTGWEKEAEKSPEDFIKFVGPIYNPGGDAYVNQILALVDEAESLLQQAPSQPITPVPIPAGSPRIIVIDPGHGGTVKIGGSSPNNANSPSGEKEKDWVLDIAKRTRAALLKQALDQGKNISVFLTREADVNVGLSARANVVKAKKAGLFLSIHFNGFDNKVRGVETLFDETNNVNADEDKKFAAAIQKEALAAMHEIDPDTKTMAKYDRKVKAQSLGVLEDIHLGNTLSSHPCRACLVELEFMDTKAVEKQLSLTKSPTQAAKNRDRIAAGLAKALLSQV